MTDRLRATLAVHFTKHIKRGDWVSCLKALSGCAESGTTLQTLPYESLLPFLVTNGQWETALRLSNEFITASKHVSVTGSASARTVRTNQREETQLCETILQVAIAPGAMASPGAWKVAAAIVQRAARNRVRLSDETVQAALAATRLWQSTCEKGDDSERGASSRRDALQLMHDLLVADHQLRVSAAKRGVMNEKQDHSMRVQSDIIDALHSVLYSDDATNESFTLLHEQLRASFAVSWTSAVHTVLLACSGQVNELAYLAARPDVAERTLHITLQCIFDEGVITSLPGNILSSSTHPSGNGYTSGTSSVSGHVSVPGIEERYGAASRAFWRRILEKDSSAELPKWEAVVDLALAALRLREKNQIKSNCSLERSGERSNGIYDGEEEEFVCQLAVAGSLALAWPVSQSITSEWSPERLCVCASRVANAIRALLLHGAGAVAAVSSEVHRQRMESLVAEAVVLLLQAHVRLCGTEMKVKDGGDACAYARRESTSWLSLSCALETLGSGLVAGRAVLWDSILFPNNALESLSVIQRTRSLAAWRSLLRRIFFSNANLLHILFPPDETQSHTTSNSSDPNLNESTSSKRPSGRRRRRPLPPGPATRTADAIAQLQCLVLFIAPGARRGRGALPGLSEALTNHEDMDTLGRGLLAASKREGLTAGEVTDVWRLYMESVPRQRVGPLLRSMLRVVEEEDTFAVSRLALVTVVHERGSVDFTLDEQAERAGDLLRGAFPRTEAWRTAIALFEQSPRAICQQHYNQQLEGEDKAKEKRMQSHISTDLVSRTENPTTVRYVLNALVLDAAPPRWREALQVIEVLRNSPSALRHMPNATKDDDHRRAAWAPLTESERIDLYETLAPMRQRRHWRAAMDLLDSYDTSQRRLGPHDVGCFAFAAASGPLSCASRLLSALGPHGKSRVIARAALVASARHTKRIVSQDSKHLEKRKDFDKTAMEQERVLVIHEAKQVAQLALESWEVPIVDEADFKFICEKLQSVCAGDRHAARVLLRRSTLLDSPQAKANLQALVREVSLCHATQDTASAIKAYQRFREHLDGMIVPTETMLQLMDLLVTALTESSEKDATKDDCQHLCMILQDTLFMYDVATEVIQGNTDDNINGYIALASDGMTFLYRVYETLFRLQVKTSTVLIANPQTLTYAPQLICVLVEYLKQSSTRLLRCLPEFLSVLSALLLSADDAKLSQLAVPIHTLTCHVQKLQDAMGPVVPLECVLHLRVLSKTMPSPQSCDEGITFTKRSGGKWDPAVFVMENDALSRDVYQNRLNETVEEEVIAVYSVLQEEQEKGLTYLDRRWRICASAIQTLRFVVQQRYGDVPPLAALLVAISMALRYIHTNPINNNSILNVNIHHKMMEVLFMTQELFDVFYTRLTAAELAFATMPNSGVSAAAAAVLKHMLYDATRYSSEFVHLIANFSRIAVQQMEHDAQLDLDWIHRMVQLTADASGVCSVWEETSSLREPCRKELKQNVEALERLILKNNLHMDSNTVGTRLVLRVLYASLHEGVGFVQEAIEETLNCVQKNEIENISDMCANILTAVALLQTVKSKTPIDGIALLRVALRAYSQRKGKDLLENTSDAQLCALIALKTARFGSAWVVQKAFGPFPEMIPCAYATAPFVSNSTEVELAELFTYVLLASSHHITEKQKADPIKVMESVGTIAPHRWDLAWSLAKGLPLMTLCDKKVTDTDPEAMLRHRLTVALQCSGPWPPGLALALILETREANDKWRNEYPELLEATTGLDATQCWRKLIRQLAMCGTEPEQFVSRLQSQSAHAASLLIGNSIVTKHGSHPIGSLSSRWQCVFTGICTSEASVQFIAIAEMTSLGRFRDFLHAFTAFLSRANWDELSLGAQELLLRSSYLWSRTLSLVSSSRIVESSRKVLGLDNPKSLQSLCQNDLPLLSFPKALFTTAQLAKTMDPKSLTLRRALRLCQATPHRVSNLKDDSFFQESPCGFTSLQYAYALQVETAYEREFLLSLACCESMDAFAKVLESVVSKPMRMELLQSAWNLFLVRRVEVSSLQTKAPAPRGGNGGPSAPVLPTEENPSLRVVCAFLGLTSLSESIQSQQLVGEMIAHSTSIHSGVPSITVTHVEEALNAVMKSATYSIAHVDKAAVVHYAHNLLTNELNDSKWLSLWPPLSLEMIKSRKYIKDFLRHAGTGKTQERRGGNAQEKEKPQMKEAPHCCLRHPLAVAWTLQQQMVLSLRVAPSRRPVMGLINTLRSYVETGVAYFTPPHGNKKEQDVTKVFEQLLSIRGSGAGIVVDVFLSLALKSWPLTGKAAERDRDTIRHVVDAIFPHHGQTHETESVRNGAFLVGYIPVSRGGMQSLTSLLVLRDGLERRGTATAEHVVNLLRMEQQREAFRQRAARDTGLPLARICMGQPRHAWDVQVPLLFFLRAFLATLNFVNPLGWHGERQSSLDRAYTALLDFMCLHAEEAGEVTMSSRAIRSELERIFGPDAVQVIFTATGAMRTAVDRKEREITLSQMLSFFAGEWKGYSPSLEHDQMQKQTDRALALPRRDSVDVLIVKDDSEQITSFSNLEGRVSPIISVTSLALDALRTRAIVPTAAAVCRILEEGISAAMQRGENSREVAHAVLRFFISVAPLTVVSTPTLERVLSLLAALQKSVDHHKGHRNAMDDAKVTCDTLDLVLRRLQYISLATPSCVLLLCEMYASSNLFMGADQTKLLSEMLLWRCAVESSRIPRASLTIALHTLNASSARSVRCGCLQFLLGDHSKPHFDAPFLQLGIALDTRLPRDESFLMQLLRGLVEPDGSCVPWRRATRFLQFMDRNARVSNAMDLDRMRLCLRVVLLERTLTLNASDMLRRMWLQTLSELIVLLCPSKPTQPHRCSSAKESISSNNVFNIKTTTTTTCVPPSGAADANTTNVITHTNTIVSGLNLIDAKWMDRAAAVALRALHLTRTREEWFAAFWLTRHVINASLFSSSSGPSTCVWWSSADAVLFHTLQYITNACDGAAIPIAECISYIQLIATHHQPSQSSIALTQIKRDRRATALSAFVRRLSRHPYLRWADAIALLDSLVTLEAALAPSPTLRHAMEELVETVMRRLYMQQSYEALLRFADAARQKHCPPRGREAMESLTHAASIVLASPSATLPGLLQMLCTDSSSSSSSSLLSSSASGVSIDAVLREQSIEEREERARRLRDLLVVGRATDAAAMARHTPALMHTREFGEGCADLLRVRNARAIVRFFDALLNTAGMKYEMNDEVRSRKTEELIDEIVEEDEEEGPNCKRICTSAEKREMKKHREQGTWLMTHIAPVALELALDAFAALANSSEGCGGIGVRRAGLFVAAAYLRHTLPNRKADQSSHNNSNNTDSRALAPRAVESLTVVFRVLARQVPVKDVVIISDAVDEALREAEKGSQASELDSGILIALQKLKPVARPLVQLFSGALPDTAARLCDALLKSSLLSSSSSSSSREVSDAGWIDFLRCTKAYNAAVVRADMHCRKILSGTLQSDAREALLRWRDRTLFSESHSHNTEDYWNAEDKECPAWVRVLAVYRACRTFIGHAGMRGAHVARLSRLLTSSGSLCVAVRAARDVLIDPPLQSEYVIGKTNTDDEQLGPVVGMEAMLMLCDALQSMKKQCLQIVSSWPGTNEEAVAILREIMMDITDLNKFVMDGLAMIIQQQQRVDYALAGGSEHATCLIRCITLTLSVGDWRASILRIIASLPPSQREADGVVLRDAVMESARDSFLLHHALRENPIHPAHSADCGGFWREVYFIVSSSGKERGEDALLGGDIFAVASTGSARRHVAMAHLETLLSLASLAGEDKEVFSAMQFLSNAVLIRYAIPLTEEAKALVKIVCIQSGGPKWRKLFGELTGLTPTTVRRPRVLSMEEESAQQRQLEASLNAVSNIAQGMQLMRDRREVGARLCHTHYQRLLQILEREGDDHEVGKEKEVVSFCLTTKENTSRSRTVMELHFAMLQDGIFPSNKVAEQLLRLLSTHPLHVLQYAQALTLLPPVTNRRHKPQTRRLHKEQDVGDQNQDEFCTDDSPKESSLALSENMLHLVVEAAEKLPDAFQQHKVTSDEAQEGLNMLAAFVGWASAFSRVPCLERDVIEKIVSLLSSKPMALLNAKSRLSLSCDVRADLVNAIVASREAAEPHSTQQSQRGGPTFVDSLYFVSGQVCAEMTDHSVWRKNAQSALRLLQQQASLHHVLRVRDSLLCRLFAALAEPDLTVASLQPLSRLAQNAALISPKLRDELARNVAEQSVLWHIVRDRARSDCGEAQASTIVRAVSRVHALVRHEFSPPDATALSRLIAMPSQDTDENDDDIESFDPPAAVEGTVDQQSMKNSEQERVMNSFHVMLRNAQPRSDLSVPFSVLMDRLCSAGQYSTACRFTALAAKSGENIETSHDMGRLLSQHVVVDCFLIWRLVEDLHGHEQRMKNLLSVTEREQSTFSLWALRLLDEQLRKEQESIGSGGNAIVEGRKKEANVLSISTLAVAKDIQKRIDPRSSKQNILGGCTADEQWVN